VKYSRFKLNRKQLDELAKVFLDIGKAAFIGSVAAFFIPSLVGRDVSPSALIAGVAISLTSIAIGVILLRGDKK